MKYEKDDLNKTELSVCVHDGLGRAYYLAERNIGVMSYLGAEPSSPRLMMWIARVCWLNCEGKNKMPGVKG
jgi:hypothetical protein